MAAGLLFCALQGSCIAPASDPGAVLLSASVHLPLLPADADAIKATWLLQQQQALQGRKSTSRTISGSSSRGDVETGDVRISPIGTPTRQNTSLSAAAFGSPLPSCEQLAAAATVEASPAQQQQQQQQQAQGFFQRFSSM
jgi:hypothetical protein